MGELTGQLCPVALGYVGRVGQNRVPAAAEPVEEVSLLEANVEPEAVAVGGRYRKRFVADVAGRHLQVRALLLERERHRAATGPDVEHARAGGKAERGLDQQLGLRAGDQDPAVDLQLDPPEAPASQQVGDRLAIPRAARDELAEEASLARLEFAFRPGDQRLPAYADGLGQEELGVQPGSRAARGTYRHHRAVERFGDAGTAHQDASAWAARRRLFSSAWRAAVNSSSPPSRTPSRSWTVSLIRWSVTRRSG